MTNIRVIRTLEYTGPEDWVRETIAKSYARPSGCAGLQAPRQIRELEMYEDLQYLHKDSAAIKVHDIKGAA